jgi:Zn-dependent protease
MPAGPWGEARAAAPARRDGGIGWALVSTALLAAWLTYLMGWRAALAAVVGVFVHEFGHVLAMNALGMGPGRIHIVPFLGGAATSRLPADTEFKGVLVALAGPVFGLLAMIPFFVAADWTGERAWLAGAAVVAFINLVNLAPAPPLDGSKALGPALARIHPVLEKAALLLVGGAAVVWGLRGGSWLFAAFVAISLVAALKQARIRPHARLLNGPEWGGSVILYLAALALCLGALALTFATMGLALEPRTGLRLLGL